MPPLPSLSPLALIVPRPTILPSSAPRTPSRSPVASHVLLSPPSAHRNSTDSWNSSNYDLDDPSAVWKDDQVRLLARTLDALPAHLITPFNGSVPPSNLLDKIARGISAAKGPNDWPHSIRATRIKLLELARLRAQEERRKTIAKEDRVPLPELGLMYHGETHRTRTPDPSEVLQARTNTPIHARRPLYRQSSMDFMDPDQPDRSECIARLSTRLQRHDRVLHHPYLRPAHTRHRSEHNKASPSTPSSSTLNSNRHSQVRKSTISTTSTSTSSSFGSPMSISAPLRPSSLRRASTLTLASTNEIHVDVDADAKNVLKNAGFRLSGGYPELNADSKVAVKVKQAPLYNGGNTVPTAPATPASKTKKARSTPATAVSLHRRAAPIASAPETKLLPRTPPNESRTLASEKAMPNQTSTHTRKFRKGHKPQLSFSSDEEEKIRSITAKKVRTCEPSWSTHVAPVAQAHSSLLLSSTLPRQKAGSDSGRSTSTGTGSKTSASSNSSTDNELSTASTETAATTVSISSTMSQAKRKSPRTPGLHVQVPPLNPSPVEATKPARRNPARNPSMFGHELPCPQRTPTSPSRIPISSPAPLSPPVNSTTTLPGIPGTLTPPTVAISRPRTLRRAARRISFGSGATNGNILGPVENIRRQDGETLGLGSAFQLA